MPMTLRPMAALGLIASVVLPTMTAAAEPFDAAAFLADHCAVCHAVDDPAGEREFETLDLAKSDLDTQLLVQEAIDQLTLGTMPPPDDIELSDENRLAAIGRLTALVRGMRQRSASTGGRTVLRRLTHREYRNTVADLLGLDDTLFDPTLAFPDEYTVEHLDNVGDALVTSGHLLGQYLDAAEAYVDRAFDVADDPEVQTWTFKDRFPQQPELDGAHRKAFGQRYLCLYDHPRNDKPEGAFGPLLAFGQGVPHHGTYEVRVLAEALHRNTTPYGPKAIRIDLGEPFRLGIRPGDTRIRDQAHTQPIEPLLAQTELTDETLEWVTFRVPLEARMAPRLTFENGLTDARNTYARVFRLHKDTLPPSVHDAQGIVAWRNAVVKHGQLPHIRIHEVQIRGPLDADAATPRERLLGEGDPDADTIRERLLAFAERAFRRPLTAADRDRLLGFLDSRLAAGQRPIRAFRDGLAAVLCSPEFLFFQTPPADARDLDSYGIAERLAYFLTSTRPDDELWDAAGSGGPLDRLAHARRLLASPASEAFVADFLDAWLNLRALGSMPPDPDAFAAYYAADLRPDMLTETRLFLRDAIDRNVPVAELLTARHGFVNRDLAKLYGIADQLPADDAAAFRRVEFADPMRGGLLGQASVLTVSANGIETSPVTRGVWLLECLLASPPPPPPDDVPAIEPDIRNATTIREQLEKHRSDAACAACHRNIDPPGFALESFDPIGQTRRFYPGTRRAKKRLPVDATGTLASGERFDGVADLRDLLAARERRLARGLLTKLAGYAVGRRIEPGDRGAIEAILDQTAADGYRVRDLLLALVASDLFARG